MGIDEISYRILGAAYKVHRTLGPGLLERIYEEALAMQLGEDGLSYRTQVPFPVFYRGHKLATECRFDMLVEDEVVVELKSVSEVTPLFKKQLLTYLKISGKSLGLLINFNEYDLKDGITRIVNNYAPL